MPSLSQQRCIGSEPVGLFACLNQVSRSGSHGFVFQIAPENFYAETHLMDLASWSRRTQGDRRTVGERCSSTIPW